MILAIFISVFLAAATAMFSAESLVFSIIGGAVAMGVTQWLKNSVEMKGAWAMGLSLIVSLLTAIGALIISTILNGDNVSYDMLPALGAQVFTLATLAYKLILADGEPTDDQPTATAPSF